MIKLVTDDMKLTEADVLGKIVFVENIFRWPGFCSPRLVTSVSKSRVNVAKLGIEKDNETNDRILVDNADREDAGYISMKSVACICDTVVEANHVLAITRQNQKELREADERMKAKIAKLDGVCEDDLLPAVSPRV